MGGSADKLKGRAAIHRDQDRLEEQANRTFLKFTGDKCIVNNPWKWVALRGEAEGLGLTWPQGETALGGLTAAPSTYGEVVEKRELDKGHWLKEAREVQMGYEKNIPVQPAGQRPHPAQVIL